MESSGGGDGGSDVSYESVASEGGFEPASDRGRDPLPRIISSSHCVEVFRRIRPVDGTFCCRVVAEDDEIENGTKAKKAALTELALRNPTSAMQQLTQFANDPLSGLPNKLMRFDGAMEAWLEEMPPPKGEGLYFARAYENLNDASVINADQRPELQILRAGNRRATLWYFTLEFLQQLWPLFLHGTGIDMWERALLDRGCTIQSTHIELGRVHCPPKGGKARAQWLKALFAAMQCSSWSPEGEARTLLGKRRLTHASMSIGDAVQIGKELFVAGLTGFVEIQEAAGLLPPNVGPGSEDPCDASFKSKLNADGKNLPTDDGEDSSCSNSDGHGDNEEESEDETEDESASGIANASVEEASGVGVGDVANGVANEGRGGGRGRGRGNRNRNKKNNGRGGGGGDDAADGGGGGGGGGKGKGGKRGSKGSAKGGKGKGNRGKGRGGGEVTGNPRWVPKDTTNVAAPAERVDRRALRAQLQAERERLQVKKK